MKSDFGIITFLFLRTAPILISSGKFEFFSFLVSNGAKFDELDQYGSTLLHHAANWGADSRIIEWLLENGFEVNAINQLGETPLDEIEFETFDSLDDRKGKEMAQAILLEAGGIRNKKPAE